MTSKENGDPQKCFVLRSCKTSALSVKFEREYFLDMRPKSDVGGVENDKFFEISKIVRNEPDSIPTVSSSTPVIKNDHHRKFRECFAPHTGVVQPEVFALAALRVQSDVFQKSVIFSSRIKF